MQLTLPLPPIALHPNSRTRNHLYRAAMVKKARGEAEFLSRLIAPSQPFKRATIQPTFYLPRKNDSTNLADWLKAYLDGLQPHVIVNDSGVTLLPPLQVTGKGLDYRVVLDIQGEA